MWNYDCNYVALDTETTGLQKCDHPFMVSLFNDEGDSSLYVWDVNPKTRMPMVSKKDLIDIEKKCKGKTLIFHNRLFDVSMMEKIGSKIKWRGHRSYDTSIISHVVNSGTHSKYSGRLKELALHYVDFMDDDQSDLRKAVTQARAAAKDFGWALAEKKASSKKDGDHLYRDYWVPRAVAKKLNYPSDHPWWNLCSKYAVQDTERTMMLFLYFEEYISTWKSDDPRHRLLERENNLAPFIHRMQQTGLYSPPEKVTSEIVRFGKLVKLPEKEMQKLVGSDFNIRSTQQLSTHLFKTLKFKPVLLTETGNPSTNGEVRKHLTEEAESNPIEDKRLQKNRINFLQAWNSYNDNIACERYLTQYNDQIFDDYLMFSLNQVGTATTRFSSSNHNIKKEDPENNKPGLRHVFGPPPGHRWYCIDYSQLQLRIFAYLTKEESMIESFKLGYDFHGFVASKIFSKSIDAITKHERRIAKNCNFGFIFGASVRKIEQTAGMDGLWDTLMRLFPSAHSYMEAVKRKVRQLGYVTTPHGYRLFCNQTHKGVNYEVQGCEGDVVKEAILECGEYLEDGRDEFFPLFQIHDEIIFQAPIPKNTKQEKRHRTIIHGISERMMKPGRDIGMELPVDVEFTDTDWSKTRKFELNV